MWLSYTLPCHRRDADLVQALPSVIQAANTVGGVEILIVDYGDQPPLAPLVRDVLAQHPLAPAKPHQAANVLHIHVDRSRPHFHMAHARNVGIQQARGTFVMIASADFLPEKDLFLSLDAILAVGRATWLIPDPDLKGAIVCRRDELLAAGGFDERLEFYGPEDKELEARLRRRGAPRGTYPSSLLRVIPTPDAVKVRGYREPLSKRDMSRRGRVILWENNAAGVTVANQGLTWGQ